MNDGTATMLNFLNQTAQILGSLIVIGGFIGSLWLYAKKPWKRVATALDQVDVMSSALGRNGGKSLADEIHRQGEEQRRQGVALKHTASCVDSICDVMEKAIFLTNGKGHWVRVNRAFSLAFGYPIDSVLGMGWVSAIDQADRDIFMRDWDYAVEDRRSFRRQVRFVTRDDARLIVTFSAHPTLGSPDLGSIGWFGTIEIVSIVSPAAAKDGAV